MYILHRQILYLHVICLQLVDNNMVKHLLNIYKRLKFLQKIVIFKLSQQSSIKIKLSEMHLLTESIHMIYVTFTRKK